jgi:hypothetical protein
MIDQYDKQLIFVKSEMPEDSMTMRFKLNEYYIADVRLN